MVLEKPKREENVFVDKEKVKETSLLLQKWAESDQRKPGDISKAEMTLLAYAVKVVGKGLIVEVDSQEEEIMNKILEFDYMLLILPSIPIVIWWVFAIVNPNWSLPSVGIVGATVAETIWVASQVVQLTAEAGPAYTNMKKFVAYYRNETNEEEEVVAEKEDQKK